MIKSIHLQNFQSHKNTSISFDKGVNAIIGISDSGKTSILRALVWLITNKPAGDAFISHWGGDSIVKIELYTGDTIERGKTKKEGNYYKLNDQIFKAFKIDPPKEIQDLLNINEINISRQMDAPFLLSSNPGEVAQILNKVANLDIIDRTISNCRKDKYDIDRQLSITESRKNDLTKQLEVYSKLVDMEADVIALEIMQKALNETRLSITQINYIKASAIDYQNKIQGLGKVLQSEEEVNEALKLLEQLNDITKQCDLLSDILNQYDGVKAEIKSTSTLYEAKKEVDELIAVYDKYKEVKSTAGALKTIYSDILSLQKGVDNENEELKKLEKDFHDSMPDECPLCGQEVEK